MSFKTTVREWFRTDDRPDEDQFMNWFNWTRWNDEKIPLADIEEIEEILNDKADREAFETHLTDADAHADLFAEPNARLAVLESKTDSDNNFTVITGYTLDPITRVLTMDAGWVGTINGIEHTNVAAQELDPAIPLAAAGYSRIDLIVFDTDANFERIAGVESLFTPVAPPKPLNTLEATFLTVGDGVVNVPVIPKPKAPVTSVNGMRGDVVLNAINDLVTGGIYSFLSAEQGKVLKNQVDAINTLLGSDDVNLDTVQEIVTAIKTVQTSLSTILVNDLTTGGTTKALTAEMGKTLKGLIDGLTTNKVDKVAGERLINAAEITKLAAVTNVTTTVKSILSTALATQNVAGFVTYINALNPILVVGASEIVKYNLTDTGRVFELLLRGRSFGVGQAAIVAADVLEVTEFLNKDIKLSNYPSTRNDGQLPTNRVLSTDVNGNLKMYTIATAPAPYLEILVPDSTLPSTTTNFVLKGAFFTPTMTVVIAGQTINSILFVSDNLVKVNVTTGATEGFFAVTLNNGISATFNNALSIYQGVTRKPITSEWVITQTPVLIEDNALSTVVYNSTGIANWNQELKKTEKFSLRFNFSGSPLGTAVSSTIVELYDVVTGLNVYAFRTSYNSMDGGIYSQFEVTLPSYSNHGIGDKPGWKDIVVEMRYTGNIMYLYMNNVLKRTFTVLDNNLLMRVRVGQVDVYNIKYIVLP